MIHILSEVRILRQEGKIHKKLITRVRMLFIVSLILLGIVLFNLVRADVDPVLTTALAFLGFFLGFYLFARMNVVSWNEEDTVVESGKMDLLGFGILILYIASEVSFRMFLKTEFPLSATTLLLSGIFGTIFGRAIGTVVTIHKVFIATHPKEGR